MPQLVFGANLAADGSTVIPLANVEGSYHKIEVYPRVDNASDADACFLASGFDPKGVLIPQDRPLGVIVFVQNVPDPVPAGLNLLTRVFMPDGSKIDVVAPFQR